MRRAERGGGDEVVGDLRDHAGPVDGVDAGEPHAVAEGEVVEHGLHQRLAVVERALDGDGVHVGLRGGRHHAPLHVGDAAVREQHDGSTRLRAAEGLDGRAAGVARGGADDGHALAAGGQHAVHEAGQQLHRHVLEGERRAVEQLQHPQVAVDLHQRRHGRMAEAGIGVAGQLGELVARDGAAGEKLQHPGRDLGERRAGEFRDRSRRRAAARPSARRGRRRGPGRPAGRPRSPARGASPLVLT